MMLNKVIRHFFQSKAKYSIILIAIGSFVWSMTMVKSGVLYSFGLGFWGPNGHDGVWHLALSKSLARGSIENPVYAGEILKNYHIGFDLVIAYLSRLTGIQTSILYFQIIPPVLALLIGVLSYVFVLRWTKSKDSAFWSIFFVYFGGSFGPIIHLFRYGRLGGDSMFWAQSGATTLINPPFALSLVLLLLGLISFHKYLKDSKVKFLLIAIIFFGILMEIKVYAGILVILSLFIVLSFSVITTSLRSSEVKRITILFIGVVILSGSFFVILSLETQNLLVFYPFWFLETLMSFGERLFWERYYQAMINYRAAGNYIKGILAYGVAFLIFSLGNLGSRVIGLKWLYQKIVKIKKIDILSLFITGIIVLGVTIPMFFVQKGTAWNTIQFFYYSLTFMGIVSGITLGKYLDKETLSKNINIFKNYDISLYHSTRWVVVGIILLLTLPTTVTTLGHYLPKIPPAKISIEELSALKYLESQPDGVVLTLFLESEKRFLYNGVEAPRPLYLYDSTAYVSAYSNKPTYFDDEVNLNIMGYDWPERKNLVKTFQEDPNTVKGKDILMKIDPDYIYYIKNIGLKGLDENYLGIKNIFDNDEVIIYKTNITKL